MALTNKSFADLITFTRASTATRVNSLGLVEDVASGDPRFDYDPATLAAKGLLIEEARTNLISVSEYIAGSAWTKSNYNTIPNAAIAPDGTATATKIILADGVTATSAAFVSKSTTVASTVHSLCIYVKAAGFTGDLVIQNGSGEGVVVDLSDYSSSVVGTATSTVTEVNNGWRRVEISCPAAVNPALTFYFNSGTGDGVSGVYIWGGQVETAAFATSYIPTRPSFTSRASTATYYDSAGVLQTAAIDVPRTAAYLPINGTFVSAGSLLAEAAATNLALRSQEFDNVSWTLNGGTVTADAIAAPDGTTTADKLTPSAASEFHRLYQSVTLAATTTYSVSVYAKAAGYSRLILREDSATGDAASFNLSNGTVISEENAGTGSIQDVGNGWYRCTLTQTNATAAARLYSMYMLEDTGTAYADVTFLGDGTSGVYLWGAQVETGKYASSYIPTVASTVTRSADVVSAATATRAADIANITGTNFSDWYNQSTGTIYAEYIPSSSALVGEAANGIFSINDGTISNRIDWRQGGTSIISVGAVEQAVLFPTGAGTDGSAVKIALAFAANDFAASFNGIDVATDVAGTVPTVNRMNIGTIDNSESLNLNGHIKDLRFYPTRLTNAELQALTA
jgi:hypothetical protein